MRHEKCGNCRFVEIIKPGDVTYAECHKAAPGMSPDDGSSWWPAEPLDSPKAWCGDWAESDEAIEKRRTVQVELHQRLYPRRPAPKLCGNGKKILGRFACRKSQGHSGPCWV